MREPDSPPSTPPRPAGDDFVRNDPRQTRALRRWGLAALLLVLGGGWLFRYWQAHANAYDLLHRLYALSYLAGLGLLAVAWHAWRYARRIAASGQYPPPGGWVLGATRVVRGADAAARARQVIACAVALTLLGLYALYLPHSISAMFQPRAPIQVDPSPPAAPKGGPGGTGSPRIATPGRVPHGTAPADGRTPGAAAAARPGRAHG